VRIAEDLGVDFETVNYIKDPPDADEIRGIIAKLEDPATDLVRRDSKFKKLELNADDYVGDPDAVVALLAERKALIQRPVIIKGDISGAGELEAIIGRPNGRVTELLS
jgi:arsenate reductase